jgi:predicted Rossmann fold nucleotide-binding protein DprA/Smf involved in DNA uptake
MGRNKFVYALSQSTLVVASDLKKGGTWAGAEEAIKGKFGQVDVWTGDGATKGNQGLVSIGARPVPSPEMFWAPNVITAETKIEEQPEQLNLF